LRRTSDRIVARRNSKRARPPATASATRRSIRRADALASAGLGPGEEARIVNVFAKAEPSPDGMVRGSRHTMLDDTDISATRHARAAVGGLIAGLVGATALYVSGGAEHQGPPGGGPIAVIAKAGVLETPPSCL